MVGDAAVLVGLGIGVGLWSDGLIRCQTNTDATISSTMIPPIMSIIGEEEASVVPGLGQSPPSGVSRDPHAISGVVKIFSKKVIRLNSNKGTKCDMASSPNPFCTLRFVSLD